MVGLIGQALGFLVFAASRISDRSTLGVVDTMRIGGLYFFGFHHVAVVVTRAGPFVGRRAGFGFAAALLLVTGFAAYLLYRFGRRMAGAQGGGTWQRAMHGAKVGLSYGLFSLLLSFVIPFDRGPAHVDVGHVGAFVLPFLLGAISGGAGGLLYGRLEERRWGGTVVAAVTGGVRAFVAALVLAFVGLLVLAAVKPEDTRAYARTVTSNFTGVATLVNHVLVLPNQSMWVLVPAMGGCDGIYGHIGSVSVGIDALCYSHFPGRRGNTVIGQRIPPIPAVARTRLVPRGRGVPPRLFPRLYPRLPFGFGAAPPAYFLFLLVPALSVLYGGAEAAKRLGAVPVGPVLAVGALSGVVFGALVSVGAWLAGFGVSVSGGVFDITARAHATIGPRIGGALVLGLVWGVVGCAVGAALWARVRTLHPTAAPEEAS